MVAERFDNFGMEHDVRFDPWQLPPDLVVSERIVALQCVDESDQVVLYTDGEASRTRCQLLTALLGKNCELRKVESSSLLLPSFLEAIDHANVFLESASQVIDSEKWKGV